MSLETLLQKTNTEQKPIFQEKLDQYPASFASKNSLDPRSDDLPSDSRLWELILKAAQKYDMTLFSGLLFLRQQGCHIVTINDSRYKIEPILGMPGGWASQREYETFRNESMMKYFPKIKELLDCLYQTVHRKVSE